MEVFSGPVVLDMFGYPAVVALTGEDLDDLAWQLLAGVRLFKARGLPPEKFVDLSDRVNATALHPAGFRKDAQARAYRRTGRGSARFSDQALVPSSAVRPEWLSTREAAKRAGVSESYMARVARRRDVTASGGEKRPWFFEPDSFAAWDSQRRKMTKRKAA